MNTTGILLVAMLVIFTVPSFVRRLGMSGRCAPLAQAH